jgi:hypothetical protein
MSAFWAYLLGGFTGVIGTGLARWWLAARRVRRPGQLPCALVMMVTEAVCETCGERWPISDTAFCSRAPLNVEAAFRPRSAVQLAHEAREAYLAELEATLKQTATAVPQVNDGKSIRVPAREWGAYCNARDELALAVTQGEGSR